MKKTILCVLVSAIVGSAAACLTVGIAGGKPCSQTDSTSVASNLFGGAQYRTVNLELDDYPDFTYAAENSVDAVVYVKVTVQGQSHSGSQDIFDFFFGLPGGRSQKPQERTGSGSGVIITPDGYIVTNNHVVGDATKIEVTLNSNQTYEATLVGTDPATDVAIIKIDAHNLPTIPFGDSDQLRLGEWVIAIGSPYDLRSTITAGIVSAKGRSMPNYSGEFKIESFIQTDAAVNPGNSGGALVNKAGKLVGINTAIISQTGQYAGYSFAVPSNIVKKIAYDLIDYGSVKRAMLGITMRPIDEEIAKEMKLSDRKGVYVHEVSAGGAADKAGIKQGDIILSIDGTATDTPSAVQASVNSYHPGDKADITLLRDGEKQTVTVKFQENAADTGSVDKDGAVAFYGSKIATASSETLAKLNVKEGVEIVSVGPGKVMEQGVRAGFVILYVNNKSVKTPQDVIDIAKKSDRAVFIEGVTAEGRPAYFGFGIK
ncbi:MAG: Do family serine endopeptidase [Bacteroidales bacterium]|nr:Do family serine endopeptidase [Bacteroidales bacterium]